jgi:DNase/tRNase domain of colicin-like bacteriocin
VYEPEPTPEPAIDPLNTPLRIILDPSENPSLPDTLKLPKGYENLGSLPVLGDKPTVEQLKEALKSSKIDCASYLAGYSCGQHDAPAVPSGDIIQVKTGDEIAINSVGFEVVELDGSGNGKGIVKVSMFNNAKFGVEFKGIKVAKGGCVVAGEAILSNVDVALLSEEQRKKLAETYATFTKVLAIADSLAPQIAETYNSIADLLKAVRAKAKIVIDKIAKNEKPSTKELKDLAKLSETAVNAKKKELEGLKKQAGADTSKYVASLGTWLVKQDNALACVKTLPSSEPDPKTKKGGPFFDEGSYFGGCDISALTEEEPENNTAFIGVQAIECLTGASLDLAFYYSSIWISMRFDDDIPDDKKPSFGDFEAITHYKDFSWGEAFTSAGISCVGAMLPPFLAPETARKITIGLSVLAGAAEGFATETVKQYEIAEKAIVKQKGKADMMEVVQKIAWKPVIVNAAVGGMITGAVSFLTTSKRFGKLVEVIKKKFNLTDLADTKQGQKIKDYLSGLGQKTVIVKAFNKINGQTNPLATIAGSFKESINKKYRVFIKETGFPDFSPWSQKNVNITMDGNYDTDFAAANFAAFKEVFEKNNLDINSPKAKTVHLWAEGGKFKDYTWHHHENLKTMQLVPKDLNNPSDKGLYHFGGVSVLNHNKNFPNDKIIIND